MKVRMMIIVISTIISFAVLGSIALYQSKSFMMYLLKDKIEALTESTLGVANSLNEKVKTGEITIDEAKKEYAEVINLMRYDDGNEYFFAVDYEGNFIAMGGAPELVGQNIINLQDSVTGNYMTRDFIKLAKSGGGFYDHYWPKAGMTQPEPKVAYVIGYEPWKMYVGTGLYFDNIDALFKEFASSLGLVILGLTSFLATALYTVSHRILSRINWIKEAMNEVASGDADLRKRLDVHTKDEFSEVAKSFNAFVEDIQLIVKSVREASHQVKDSARQMSESSFQTSEIIQSQLNETELAATAINQMSVTIQEIANNANLTSHHTKVTADNAEDGRMVVDKAISSVHQLGDEIKLAHEKISDLRHRSDDISSILEVIKDIADKTNLLALNAAIEAARAGNMGKGFAVVADEVRNLASRTQQSTTEIESIISYLQSASVHAHESMEKSREKILETIGLTEQSGIVLNQIRENTFTISDMNTQIATATEQQAVVAEEINRNVTEIHGKSKTIASNSEVISEHSSSLNNMSLKVEEELQKFSV